MKEQWMLMIELGSLRRGQVIDCGLRQRPLDPSTTSFQEASESIDLVDGVRNKVKEAFRGS